MNNEKEIEEMAKAIDYVIYRYSSDPYTLPDSNMSECIAHDLIVRGYGNIKQAVKELAERLKINISKRLKDNIGTKYPQSTVQSFHDKAQRAVDVTITKFYGADE